MHRALVCIFLLIVFTVPPVIAHLPEYSPFTWSSRPALFAIQELVMSDVEIDRAIVWEFRVPGRRDGQSRNMVRAVPLSTGVELEVLSPNRRRVAGPFKFSEFPTGPYGYTADLNHDGVSDFVLANHSGGNGAVGGGLVRTMFLISSDGGSFKASSIYTLYLNKDDFLDCGNRRFCFVHTSTLLSQLAPAERNGC